MKKIILNILIVTLFATGFVAVPKPAYAACNLGTAIVGSGFTDCVSELVIMTVMPIVGKLLQVSAYLFDKAIIMNMNISQFVQTGNSAVMSPVETIWRLIRDISGMFFIFLLLFSSIKMILGLDSSKGVIAGVVIAGLFVNFSLFATKVAIDASNSLTLTIYNAIAPRVSATVIGNLWGGDDTDPNGQIAGGISSKIMQVVNLQSLFASTKTATQQTNYNVNSIVIVTGGIVLMLVLGIAFLAAGVMFLWRFIYLLALMAFSPFWALSFAFPQLADQKKEFIKNLMAQCLFAPVFLFFVYIALRVFNDPQFIALTNPGRSTFANVFAGSGIAPLIQYGLVVFIIYSGLATASKLGAKGGEFGIKWLDTMGKWGQGMVKGATMGTLRFAGRNTYGLAASKLAESDFINDRAGKGFAGKMVLTSLKGVAKNYDENVEKKKKDSIAFGDSLGYNHAEVLELERRNLKIKDGMAGIDSDIMTLEQSQRSTTNAAMKARIGLDIDMKKKLKKRYEAQIKTNNKEITDTKNKRKSDYAQAEDPSETDPATGEKKLSIWNRVKKGGFVAADEEKAAASINASITEDEVKKLKEKLDEKKKDREKAKDEVGRLTKEKKERKATWNSDKEDALNEAYKKYEEVVKTEIMPLEKEIRDMEFEAKKLKDLSS